MSDTLSKTRLRELRNRIAIIPLIAETLELLFKTRDGHFRFMCPLCHDFDTAANPRTNLNPIDIVMTVKRYSFMQAVRYLDPILDQLLARERNRPGGRPAPQPRPTP